MNKVTYRQLQSYAKALKLPGNMKYQVLWDMVSARKAGNERRVVQLMAEQKRLRFERRLNRKVARTLEDNNLRLAQLSSAAFNNSSSSNNFSSPPALMDGAAHAQEIVIDASGQMELPNQLHPEWDYAKDLKMVHLLDPKVRHEVMVRELAEYRKAVQLLPVYKPKDPHSRQCQQYQFAPVTQSSTPYVPYSEPQVPLAHPPSIQGTPNGSNMSQMIDGPNFEYKQMVEPNGREMKCYQIEDLMGPMASNNYVAGYPIGQYSGGYHVPVGEDQFGRFKMFDHEGYQQRHSAPSDQTARSLKNDAYGVGVSPNSDTMSADELGMEMTFEDEQYAGFEPYIEEVISSQPFEPEHNLPPSHLFKSEVTVLENLDATDRPSEKIIVDIGAETVNHNNLFMMKKELIDATKDETGEGGAEVGNTEESAAPGALLTSSELCPALDSLEPDLVDKDTCDSSSPDGELEIVLPEDVDDVQTEDKESSLLIKEPSNGT